MDGGGGDRFIHPCGRVVSRGVFPSRPLALSFVAADWKPPEPPLHKAFDVFRGYHTLAKVCLAGAWRSPQDPQDRIWIWISYWKFASPFTTRELFIMENG
jgi:hypothetical protein